ncbi:MAG TPA: helix-turn-helix transcriptional regulator, partial [Rectinemataceae bacterium]|nr:helix-turn-helix transcriptional regulator [Rectinemataceae bacterium]
TAALAYRLVRGPEAPFRYRQTADEAPQSMAAFRAVEERIFLCLRAGAVDQAQLLSSAFLEALAGAGLSPQRVRHEVLALFARALDELGALGISPATVSAEFGADYYAHAESLGSPAAVGKAVEKLASIAAGFLGTRAMHLPEWKILDFKEYVERHYRDPKLSIARAAEGLSISESYLSKLLRRHLGKSFVDYLTEFRVARARELLAGTDLLTYEVAESVGFADARYFSTVFRRLSGSTPSEYRSAAADRSPAP